MLDDLLYLPDWWMSRVTMYRLIMYYLAGLLAIAMLEAWRGMLGYSVESIAVTAGLACLGCLAINALFAHVFEAPRNDDSALITGLILALILGPVSDRDGYALVAWAATLAMASKYVLAWRRLHLFNPAAVAVALTGELAHRPATWWVATTHLTFFVLIGGVLLVRKLRRAELVIGFLAATLTTTLVWNWLDNQPIDGALRTSLIHSPIWFLAFVMLTEPVCMPSRRRWQIAYGAIAGILVAPQFHVGSQYLTPELGLVFANALAVPFRSRRRIRLTLQRAMRIGPNLMDFLYLPDSRLRFRPGQYMEWELDHRGADSRGKRRYFTIASGPAEDSVRLGVKFEEQSSSYKRAMLTAKPGAVAFASQLAGEFVLPKDRDRKLLFLAGGIGVTPFRSMLEHLTRTREDRDMVLLYAAPTRDEMVYRDVFDAAQRALTFRTVFITPEPSPGISAGAWESGRIDAELLKRCVADINERYVCVSGSPAFVHSVRQALLEAGVKRRRIKIDYFSGLAS